MSSKIFQNVITQMKDSLDRTIGVTDDRGVVIACSDLTLIGNRLKEFSFLEFTGLSVVNVDGRSFRPLAMDGSYFDYVAFADGEDADAGMLCAMAAVAFNESKQSYDEKHNKAAFIKNIISDNILPGDVYVRAKELHFTTDDPRCVILVRMLSNQDVAAVEMVQRLFPAKQTEFVFSVNEKDIVIVKLLKSAESLNDAVTASELVRKKLKEELGIETVVGISTVAEHLRELAQDVIFRSWPGVGEPEQKRTKTGFLA